MEQVTEFIRAMVRPFLAVSAWVVVLYIAVTGGTVPEWLVTITAALTGFYFGDRAARRTPPTG